MSDPDQNLERRDRHITQMFYRRLKAFTRVLIILLNEIHGTVGKFAIIFAASTIFVSVRTLGTGTRTTDRFAAGAAYAAVMVVFVLGNEVAGP